MGAGDARFFETGCGSEAFQKSSSGVGNAGGMRTADLWKGVLKIVIPVPCCGTGQAPAGTQQLFLKSAEKYYEAIQNGRSKSCPHSDF